MFKPSKWWRPDRTNTCNIPVVSKRIWGLPFTGGRCCPKILPSTYLSQLFVLAALLVLDFLWLDLLVLLSLPWLVLSWIL